MRGARELPMRKVVVHYACVCVAAACYASLARAADHPLEPLSKSEIQVAFTATLARFRADEALPDEALRYSMVALLEPPKSFVLGWSPGKPFARKASVQVLHYPSNRFWVVEVDLKRKKVARIEQKQLGTQPAVTSEEFVAAEEIIRAYEPFTKAMLARGLSPDYERAAGRRDD
jgi:primary-amine oxidase